MRPFSLLLAAFLVVACNESDVAHEPLPEPQIISVTGPKDGIVTCEPKAGGGACPIAISYVFRLPEAQFVQKAIVRFQGDGSDVGVDRQYALEPTFGKNDGDVPVVVNASIPPTILRTGALFTYSVRLVTGAGGESPASTLTVSVQ